MTKPVPLGAGILDIPPDAAIGWIAGQVLGHVGWSVNVTVYPQPEDGGSVWEAFWVLAASDGLRAGGSNNGRSAGLRGALRFFVLSAQPMAHGGARFDGIGGL